MSHRAGNAIVFILGVTMIPCVQADVLNYARDWTQREEVNKSSEQSQEERRPAPWEKSKTPPKASAKEKINARPSVAVKATTAPAKIKERDEKSAKTPDIPPSGVIKYPEVRREQKTINKNEIDVYLPDSRILGRWLKSVIQHISATPSERMIKELYLKQKDEIKSMRDKLAQREGENVILKNNDKERHLIMSKLGKLEAENGQWKRLTQEMQKNLKLAKYPPLPTSEQDLADFAAGMAMGVDIVELLEQRNEQGVQIDRKLFLAGITETLRGERRLSQEAFEQHLARANQRVSDAIKKTMKNREVRDKEWLHNFIKQENTLAAGNEAWFRVIHTGNEVLPDNESATELTLSFIRRLTDGTLIADSDLSGLVLQEKISELPTWLRVVAKKIRLNGEAEFAVTVNEYGDPAERGNYVEHWKVRVVKQRTM